jgi:hypothetical protein
MTNETSVPKFVENGKDAGYLDTTPQPVYYGFNCTPRQVRYYRLEKSVESILAGGYTRQSVEAFLEKVKANQAKAVKTAEGHDQKMATLQAEKANAVGHIARELFRKKIGQVETRKYNYKYDVLDKYERAVNALTTFLL